MAGGRAWIIGCWLLAAVSWTAAIAGEFAHEPEQITNGRWTLFAVWLIGALILDELAKWRKL